MTSPYKAGTVTVIAGDAVVTGSGTAWQIALVSAGVFSCRGLAVPILSVESDSSLTLAYGWPGSSESGVGYAIAIENAAAASIVWVNDRLAQILSRMVASGIPPRKSGSLSERDALELGADDDQFIFLRAEIGEPWEFYRWSGTEWIGPFDPRGEPGDDGDPGVGDRFDIGCFIQGRPRADEIVVRHVFSDTPISFAAGLEASRASSRVAAAASTVFSARKNGVEFATVTFAASESTGSFACPVATIFSAGDVFTLVAPGVRDASLADISATFAGSR